MHRRLLADCLRIAATALVVLAGSSTAALAQTVTVAPRCVVNPNSAKGSRMAVVGGGFTAGDSIALGAGTASGTTTTGSDGAFATTIFAPTLAATGPGARKFTLTARDETNGAAKATTSFWVANLAFGLHPASGKPSRHVRFTFSGFKSGKTIYGHYVHGSHVVTHRFGRATGVCGQLKAKAQLFPGGHPRYGSYKVQMDQSHRYSKKSLPRVDSSIAIS